VFLLSSKKQNPQAFRKVYNDGGDAGAFRLDPRLWHCQSCEHAFAKVAIVL